MNALLSIWTWFEIGLVALVGFFVQLIIAIVTWPFDRKKYIAGRCFRRIGITAAQLTPFWHFRTYGEMPQTLPKRLVVVSNHESNADPFIISLLPWEMKWLGKASLFKIPAVGWSMWLAGDIPVRRGESESAKGAMATCSKWLDKGVPIMIFPEGTRSKTQELLPFKDGAFRLAIEKEADVLPVAVSGTRHSLPKHSWRFAHAKALVTVGKPISTRGMTLADVERLKAMAREQILTMRDMLVPMTSASLDAAKEEGVRAA